MAKITSPRLNVVDRLCRKLAPMVRRELGEISRQLVQSGSHGKQAMDLAHKLSQQIAAELTAAYPQDGITIGDTAVQASQGPMQWFINPLGGIENLAHGGEDIYVLFLIQHEGLPVEAAVYAPLTDGLAQIQKGGGAFGFQSRLRVSGRLDMAGTLLRFFPAADGAGRNSAILGKLANSKAQYRISGAAALDILAAAGGQADALIAADLPPAEAGLAHLCMLESGGKCTEHNGTLILSNAKLEAQLSKLLA